MQIPARKISELLEGTRSDCHEPEEQGISFVGCVGTQLDNAFGSGIYPNSLIEGIQEVVLLFHRQDENGKITPVQINLATLLAFAKMGANKYLLDNEQGKCRHPDEVVTNPSS